jgi:formate dehydrogenase iron-sulfur subunit
MMSDLLDAWRSPEPPATQQETGFFTDTTLCIGCKACEIACKQWNQLPADGFHFTGNLTTTPLRYPARRGGTSPSSNSLTATLKAAGVSGNGVGTDNNLPGRWLMMSDVCKHCVQAPSGSVPTGAHLQRVRQCLRAAGHLQRLRLLRRGVSVRRD